MFCSITHGKAGPHDTKPGGKFSTVYIRQLLPRLARKARIEKRCLAHMLRHTHASELLGEGTNIGDISKQLGHSSIAMTARYLDHINPLRVIEVVRAREWTL